MGLNSLLVPRIAHVLARFRFAIHGQNALVGSEAVLRLFKAEVASMLLLTRSCEVGGVNRVCGGGEASVVYTWCSVRTVGVADLGCVQCSRGARCPLTHLPLEHLAVWPTQALPAGVLWVVCRAYRGRWRMFNDYL